MTLSALPCRAAPAGIEALFAQQWQAQVAPALPAPDLSRPGSISWMTRTSPPLPPEWPWQGGGLVYYAYARGMSPDLRDGEYAGPVWGMAEQPGDAAAAPAFTPLPAEITRRGTQGVRPLTAQETETLQADPAALLAAAGQEKAAGAAAAQEKLKAYYCLEKSLGNLPEPIPQRHAAFFAWLGCP
jgi:hypothetical protein